MTEQSLPLLPQERDPRFQRAEWRVQPLHVGVRHSEVALTDGTTGDVRTLMYP